MDIIYDFWNDQPEEEEVCRMDPAEYFKKSQAVFEKLSSDFFGSFSWVHMKDGDYPSEDICDKCTGCGLFHDSNGDEKECVIDREEGECFTQVWDFTEMCENAGNYMEDLMELLMVQELSNNLQSTDGSKEKI